MVSTVLGSCIAVTLLCPRLKSAAICHAVLPYPARRKGSAKRTNESFRYVSTVVPLMVNYYLEQGAGVHELQAKLFGGASIHPKSKEMPEDMQVGSRNVEEATSLLSDFGLRIEKSHVGGISGRKIIFNTESGEVLLKVLTPKK